MVGPLSPGEAILKINEIPLISRTLPSKFDGNNRDIIIII